MGAKHRERSEAQLSEEECSWAEKTEPEGELSPGVRNGTAPKDGHQTPGCKRVMGVFER